MRFSHLSNLKNRAPEITAFAGLIVYAVLSFIFAHTTPSNLDEGSYLYKGYMYALGVYRPFEPYGFHTNKPPLAFLIPGYFQWLFGAGLRVGRYLAVLEGVLAVIGTWIVARRMSSRWLAAVAVWVLAIGFANIKVYSVGATQSLVAFFIVWILVFSLGGKQPLWQLMLASAFASLMVLARNNMVAVLPLLVLYIFWEYGWKHALWSLIVSSAVFISGYAAYWPDVLQVWVGWLPIMPQTWGQFSEPPSNGRSWNPEVLEQGRILSVFQGFRWHFFALTGSLLALFIIPWRLAVKDNAKFRSIVFLTMLFAILVLMHSSATLNKDYCVFCFSPYLSFFSFVGIVLAVTAIPDWNSTPSNLTQALIVAVVLIVSTGIGFATFEDTGKTLADLPFPRIREGRFLLGFNTVGEVLANKFHLDQPEIRRIVSTGAGFIVGAVVIVFSFILKLRRYKNDPRKFGYILSCFFIFSGFVLTPIFQGKQGAFDCSMDVIASHEENGVYLQQIVPPGVRIFWDGGLSFAPMLYLPEAKIYPQQVNNGYSFRAVGNTDDLLRYGLWNAEAAAQWRAEADVFIVEEWRYAESWNGFFTPDQFIEHARSPQPTSCLPETRLRIFTRQK